jgi:hypothetical protein
MNDSEREQWVDNDEGLYNLMRRSRLGKRRWVRENPALIDSVIEQVTSGSKRQHFMAYDPVPKWVRKLD